MTFNDYQSETNITAIYRNSIWEYVKTLKIPEPEKANELVDLLCKVYVVLGLAGEAGELAGKMKKIIRDSQGYISQEKKRDILDENGDITWYNGRVSTEFGENYDQVAQNNLTKLFGRKERGTISGSGDNR